MRLGSGLGLGSAQATAASSPTIFVADLTALASGDMTAAALLSATGLTFTRASDGFTVQTSAATVAGSLSGNDRPRVGGIGSAWGLGLVLEEARTNSLTSSRILNGTGWGSGAGTYTASTGVDGAANACDRMQINSGSFSQFQSATLSTASLSFWLKQGSGGATWQTVYSDNGGTAAHGGPAPANWTKENITLVGASGNVIPADGRDFSGIGGVVAGARDCLIDFIQLESGLFVTEAVVTTTATKTRAGESLSVSTGSTLVSSGRVSLSTKIVPKGSSAQYAANMYLWGDANSTDAAWVDSSTKKVNVRIGGTTQTLATVMSWVAGDVLDFFVAGGGGSLQTTAAYRTNGGAATQLGTATALGNVAPSGAMNLLCNGTSNQFSAWVQSIAAYASGQKPSWA